MDDCTGCGQCCKKACAVGARVFNAGDKCPALIWDDEQKRHFCKLIQIPGDIGFRYRSELNIGTGCDNPLKHEIMDLTGSSIPKMIQIDRHFKLFLHCLAREWISGDTKQLLLMAWANDLQRIGTDHEIIKAMVKEVQHIFTENTPAYLKNFM